MSKNVQIVLTVDANSLYQMSNPSQEEINDYSNLSDDNDGIAENGKVQDFLSNVYLGHNVEWIGSTTDNGYSIAIDRIVYDFDLNDPNDKCFLEDDVTILGTGGCHSKVVATIKDQIEMAKTLNIYKIEFSVHYNNVAKSYLIDPKLRANP
ncbi:hypothetical protein [Flavobacterium sp. N3904]|uniref:hypothetical protein n=1 Tax=Flavobacterium sp. N3904 TaxID=2986835 RepID=UPI002225583F|nr:hypothetical protein [Flavobacterium sp. N3904]